MSTLFRAVEPTWKPFDGAFYKQMMLASDIQNKQFIHRGYLYSAIVICLFSHFAVMTVLEVFLNQGS